MILIFSVVFYFNYITITHLKKKQSLIYNDKITSIEEINYKTSPKNLENISKYMPYLLSDLEKMVYDNYLEVGTIVDRENLKLIVPSLLDKTILDSTNPSQKSNPIHPNDISQADEILKFKNLLDIRVITEEEFEIKKQEILNIKK